MPIAGWFDEGADGWLNFKRLRRLEEFRSRSALETARRAGVSTGLMIADAW